MVSLNCTKRRLGRKLNIVYLDVIMALDGNDCPTLLTSGPKRTRRGLEKTKDMTMFNSKLIKYFLQTLIFQSENINHQNLQ